MWCNPYFQTNIFVINEGKWQKDFTIILGGLGIFYKCFILILRMQNVFSTALIEVYNKGKILRNSLCNFENFFLTTVFGLIFIEMFCAL